MEWRRKEQEKQHRGKDDGRFPGEENRRRGRGCAADAGIDYALVAGRRVGQMLFLLRLSRHAIRKVRQGVQRRALLGEKQGKGEPQEE